MDPKEVRSERFEEVCEKKEEKRERKEGTKNVFCLAVCDKGDRIK
jgi:hypothetical protein